MLTQIPAKLFEKFVEQQRDFGALTAKELKALVDATKPEQKALHKLLPRDKDSNNFVFARLLFDKTFVDAYDWRAVRKALAEIESRLSIKVQLTAAADAAYKQTVVHRYNEAKENAKDVEFKPALWDYGMEAEQDNLRTDEQYLYPRYLKDGTCRATHASNALGKWLKKDFGMTAHSLRHTFRDRLRASGCPLELIDQIGGWSSIGTIGSKYGQGYDLGAVWDQLITIRL